MPSSAANSSVSAGPAATAVRGVDVPADRLHDRDEIGAPRVELVIERLDRSRRLGLGIVEAPVGQLTEDAGAEDDGSDESEQCGDEHRPLSANDQVTQSREHDDSFDSRVDAA